MRPFQRLRGWVGGSPREVLSNLNWYLAGACVRRPGVVGLVQSTCCPQSGPQSSLRLTSILCWSQPLVHCGRPDLSRPALENAYSELRSIDEMALSTALPNPSRPSHRASGILRVIRACGLQSYNRLSESAFRVEFFELAFRVGFSFV